MILSAPSLSLSYRSDHTLTQQEVNMRTFKATSRLMIALMALLCAWHLHGDAVQRVNKVVTESGMTDNPGNFFGPDPREEAKKPENQAKLETAYLMDQFAVASAIVAVFFLSLVVVPLLIRVLRWLMLPEVKQGIVVDLGGACDGVEVRQDAGKKPPLLTYQEEERHE